MMMPTSDRTVDGKHHREKEESQMKGARVPTFMRNKEKKRQAAREETTFLSGKSSPGDKGTCLITGRWWYQNR